MVRAVVKSFIIILSVGVCARGNEATNPSMEGAFVEQGMLGYVAQYWTGWDEGGWPEGHFGEGSYSHEGSKSQVITWDGDGYSEFGPAGIYQQISGLSAGASYKAKVWLKLGWQADAWGDLICAATELNGRVGVDGDGGTDPSAVGDWSAVESVSGYDDWYESDWFPVVIYFSANGSTATLFIEGQGWGDAVAEEPECLEPPCDEMPAHWTSSLYIDDVVVEAIVIDANESSVEATTGVPANGRNWSEVSITVVDDGGLPISDIPASEIEVSCTGVGNSVEGPLGPTDANGVTTARIRSTIAESKVVSVTVLGVELDDKPTVEFGESYIGSEWYVDVSNTGYGNGSSENPFDTIGEAVIAATDGNTVIVSPGTYLENVDFGQKTITIRSTDPNDRWVVENTVIDANGEGAGVRFDHQGEEAVIRGFTITGASESGIYCYLASPTIQDNIIRGNTAYRGGGIGCSSYNSSPMIVGNEIMDNTASSRGGGIYQGDGVIRNCVIAWNTTTGSYSDGGGLYDCDGEIINCTIANNESVDDGGGVYGCGGTIKSCIIYGNSAGGDGAQLYGSATATYSCVEGGYFGAGCIGSDPCFADAAGGDYHLLSEAGRWDSLTEGWVNDGSTSPCIDAGDPASEFMVEPNPNGGRINMGAYGNTIYASKSVPKGYITVVPEEGYICSGDIGGPFEPNSKVYTVTNSGDAVLDYEVLKADANVGWYDIAGGNSVAGVLDPCESVDVELAVTDEAEVLGSGRHEALVLFRNLSNGTGDTERGVRVDVSVLTIGEGAGSWIYPFSTYYHDTRMQVIYLSEELGSAKTLTSLSLDVTDLPGQMLENWTIRMKHTALSSYTAEEWEDGWAVVYQADETVEETGWVNFEFDVPFEYNGSDNLLIDFSYNNDSYSSSGDCRYSQPGGQRTLYYRTNSGYGDPLEWVGTTPAAYLSDKVPNILLTFGAEEVYVLRVSPLEGFSSSGVAGGPFAPAEKMYTLENTGDSALDFEVSRVDAGADWYDIEDGCSVSGTLGASESLSVTVGISGAAGSLARGEYSDLLRFSDLSNGVEQYREVLLDVIVLRNYVSTGGSDETGDGSFEDPFRTIQHGIDKTDDGGSVVVMEGLYLETIDFKGKAITVRSERPGDATCVESTIIDADDNGTVVTFASGEDGGSCLRGFTIVGGVGVGGGIVCEGTGPVIRDNVIAMNQGVSAGMGFSGGGILCVFGSSAEIVNNVIVSNAQLGETYAGGGICSVNSMGLFIRNNTISGNFCAADEGAGGIMVVPTGGPAFVFILNNIISDNWFDGGNGGGIFGPSGLYVLHNNVYGNIPVNYAGGVGDCTGSSGNISVDPQFADTGNLDYHVVSQVGRWNPNAGEWVVDGNQSPCIDAGASGDDYKGELWPHGERVNMGAYGGTSQASMSLSGTGLPADVNYDGFVNMIDYSMLAGLWQVEQVLLVEDLNRDGKVDIMDVAELASQWLQE